MTDTPKNRFATLKDDMIAGLINAVVSVPDGLASAALAGVNPVYGLYTSITATITGSSIVSAQRMQIATTSASALAAGQAILAFPEGQRDSALFTLVTLVGIILAIFGVLRFGRLVKYVSHAVMTGFLFGIAAVLVLDQFAPMVGYAPEGVNKVDQFADLLANIRRWDLATVGIGVLAFALILIFDRTRLSAFSSLIALVIPTLIAVVWDPASVQLVNDVSIIPRGIPDLTLPDLALINSSMLLSAFSLAVVIAVQGAGVSQTTENLDGSRVSVSRDIIAQGAANIAAGSFAGIPAGGSVGQTALNINVGAKSRWAGILAGVWMLAIVLLFPTVVGVVPMAVLGALMVAAGVSAIDLREGGSIFNVGGNASIAVVATFIATLLLSVPMAVAVGVVISIILFVSSSAGDVRVVEQVLLDDGRMAELEPSETLRSNGITIIEAYGSLFFAGARTLAERLPAVGDAKRPVVVLRLRGRTYAGATLIDVLDDYAEDIEEAGGRLYLTGVDKDLGDQLRRTAKLDIDRHVYIFDQQETLGESTRRATSHAHDWLNPS